MFSICLLILIMDNVSVYVADNALASLLIVYYVCAQHGQLSCKIAIYSRGCKSLMRWFDDWKH